MKKWKSGRINTETDSKENVWWMTWETRASSSSSTCFSSYIGYYDTYCQHIFALNADTHHTCSVEVLMSKSHRGPQPHSKTNQTPCLFVVFSNAQCQGVNCFNETCTMSVHSDLADNDICACVFWCKIHSSGVQVHNILFYNTFKSWRYSF